MSASRGAFFRHLNGRSQSFGNVDYIAACLRVKPADVYVRLRSVACCTLHAFPEVAGEGAASADGHLGVAVVARGDVGRKCLELPPVPPRDSIRFPVVCYVTSPSPVCDAEMSESHSTSQKSARIVTRITFGRSGVRGTMRDIAVTIWNERTRDLRPYNQPPSMIRKASEAKATGME